MSPAMVSVTVNDRTELRATTRGATAILIGSADDHVTLLFHGDRLAAIDRLQEQLDALRSEVAEAMEPDERGTILSRAVARAVGAL